jgi:Alpha amylase, catalytic domain
MQSELSLGITIGTYPDSAAGYAPRASSLSALSLFALECLPASINLHILPFGPSNGDGGFAPSDWSKVDPDFGSWGDISSIARHRHVVVDGIYNHVGIEHNWVRELRVNPRAVDRFYSWRECPEPTPISPRGGDIVKEHDFGFGPVWLWQSYGTEVFDIRLRHPDVMQAIDEHMHQMAKQGVRGIRLDAAAHYVKVLRTGRPDGLGAAALVQFVARMAQNRGLQVWIQMDCDEAGLKAADSLSDVALQDFALSASLIATVLSGDATHVGVHLQQTWALAQQVSLIRAPRTHDGVYLRTRVLQEHSRSSILSYAKSNSINLRVLDGEPYELNDSLPKLLELAGFRDGDGLLAVALLTAIITGVPYLYLPAFASWVPDNAATPYVADPRAINRVAPPTGHILSVFRSPYGVRLREILEVLSEVRRRALLGSAHDGDDVEYAGGLLKIVRGSAASVTLYVNFGHSEVRINQHRQPPRLFNHFVPHRLLKPGGYALFIDNEIFKGTDTWN